MKVAHIFWGLGFGGIETMLVNIMGQIFISFLSMNYMKNPYWKSYPQK